VAAPFFNFSVIEPTGVIGIVSESSSSFLSLISQVAPAITTGNTAVVIASQLNPVSAITFAEIAATSDVPAGVVNIVTGDYHELASWIAEHLDVDGIDLTGIREPEITKKLSQLASVNVKRVLSHHIGNTNYANEPSRMKFWTETKTVWHPIGS
jgi:acyl-CoA reductase-like NAD-dependent aldehyde dehydrogenase